ENGNTLAGIDFRYQNTRFSDTHTLNGDAWLQKTDTDGLEGDDKAYGVNVNLNTQGNGFGGNLGYTRFGEDYFPALGFVNRRGVETFSTGGNGRYFLRDHPLIRVINTFTRYEYTRRLDTGELQSEDLFWRFLNINTHIGDQIGFGVGRAREGLDEDFEI